ERAHLRPHEVAPGGEKRLRWVVADRTREGEGQTARIPCAEGPTSQDEASGRLSCVAEVTTSRGGHAAARTVGVRDADDQCAFPQRAVICQQSGGGSTRHRDMTKHI